MYLVRRRADGKWWGNPPRRGYARSDGWWMDTITGIVPFKTVAGAKNAMHCFCWVDYEQHRTDCCRWPFCSKHKKVRAADIQKLFDAQFEIVPVVVNFADEWGHA